MNHEPETKPNQPQTEPGVPSDPELLRAENQKLAEWNSQLKSELVTNRRASQILERNYQAAQEQVKLLMGHLATAKARRDSLETELAARTQELSREQAAGRIRLDAENSALLLALLAVTEPKDRPAVAQSQGVEFDLASDKWLAYVAQTAACFGRRDAYLALMGIAYDATPTDW